MHAIEKILAKACGKRSVETGEIIMAKIDFALINDLYLQTLYSFREIGGDKVWDADKVAFIFDHYAPAPTVKSAENHRQMRIFAQENDLKHHFDINAGVCHQVLAESGLVYPGMTLIVTDSHTTTHGAFGAFGTGVGATDMACALMDGELWFKVPAVVSVNIEGMPAKGVYPKDVILYILGQMKADGAVYKAVEFRGSYVDSLDVSGRMVICNMAVEMGAKTAYVQPNQCVLNYVLTRTTYPFEVFETDPGFQYADERHFDVEDLPPQLAVPHSVDNVRPIDFALGTKVDQGFIGACTGGRLEDIRETWKILHGKKIPRYVRLIIIPASAEVFRDCTVRGYISDLMEAGATISTPGCGPCLSAHEGVLAPGEVCITASNRNFPGRMGSREADIYLASPATVAASVLQGQISDPRSLL